MTEEQQKALDAAWSDLIHALKTEKPTCYVYKFIVRVANALQRFVDTIKL